MQATEAEALRVNEETHQKAISAAAAAHSEALQAAAAAEAAAMSRLERIRESAVGQAEMTFKAAVARAEAEREAAGEYEKTTRAFASARAKALRELASEHTQAVVGAQQAYEESLRASDTILGQEPGQGPPVRNLGPVTELPRHRHQPARPPPSRPQPRHPTAKRPNSGPSPRRPPTGRRRSRRRKTALRCANPSGPSSLRPLPPPTSSSSRLSCASPEQHRPAIRGRAAPTSGASTPPSPAAGWRGSAPRRGPANRMANR